MAAPGKLPGRYNLVIEGAYERFDHQIPIQEFAERLAIEDLPNKVSVVGLEDKLSDEEFRIDLARLMDQHADDMEYQSPTVQVVLNGSFHRRGRTYDLRYKGSLYSLERLFGPQLERRKEGDWITAPF
jgi:hypothetical protein